MPEPIVPAETPAESPAEPAKPAKQERAARVQGEIDRVGRELKRAEIQGASESSVHALLEEMRAFRTELAELRGSKAAVPSPTKKGFLEGILGF